MKVSDVMSTKVITVPPTATYKEVWNTFVKHHLHALPVVDSHNEVLGILTEEDLMTPLYPNPSQFSEEFSASTTFEEMEERMKDLTKMSAKNLMNRRVVFTRPDTPVLRALSRMLIRKVRQTPVIDEEKGLVGMVTKNDIVSSMVRKQFQMGKPRRGHS